MSWNKNWLVPQTKSEHILWSLIVILCLAACSPGGAQTPVPTQTLIPSTATFTPLPPSETPTRIPALRPDDLITRVPAYLSSIESASDRQAVQLAVDDLILQADIDTAVLQVAYFAPAQWRNANLECAGEARELRRFPGYHVVLIAGDKVYDYHTDEGTRARLCAESSVQDASTEVRMLFDSVAAEIVSAARQRLASQLQVRPQSITLLEVQPMTWPDTSLGCPIEGQAYTQVRVDGYRIILRAADEDYSFHASFERLIRCDAGDEALSDSADSTESTPEVTPESTAETA